MNAGAFNGRYLLGEVAPEVGERYKLRCDGYWRAVCAWNVAWSFRAQFSRRAGSLF